MYGKEVISLKIVKNLLFWISTVCLVTVILLIAIPKLFGVEFRAVLTGSMTPEIPVGSLVIIVPTAAEEIKIGDDITFVTGGEKIVTHRVVEIDREKNEFTTWGIANAPSAKDAPNKYENILGVVRGHIPFAGRIFSWIATLSGKIILATAILAIYMLTFIFGIWTKDRKKITAAIPDGNSPVDIDSFEDDKKMFTQAFDFEKSLPEAAAPHEPEAVPARDSVQPAVENIPVEEPQTDIYKCDEEIMDLLANDEQLKKVLEGNQG